MPRHRNIVHPNDMEWEQRAHEPKFGYERKPLGDAAGGEKLGCSLFRIDPGKTAFPTHLHHANEEAIYVLEGEGTLRLGAESHAVAAGDYIALPAGGQAHQLVNTSSGPLAYLCMSTMVHPDVVEYPDSNKIGVRAGAAPGGDNSKRRLYKNFLAGDDVKYFEGE